MTPQLLLGPLQAHVGKMVEAVVVPTTDVGYEQSLENVTDELLENEELLDPPPAAAACSICCSFFLLRMQARYG